MQNNNKKESKEQNKHVIYFIISSSTPLSSHSILDRNNPNSAMIIPSASHSVLYATFMLRAFMPHDVYCTPTSSGARQLPPKYNPCTAPSK
jgi:hypothetical protein